MKYSPADRCECLSDTYQSFRSDNGMTEEKRPKKDKKRGFALGGKKRGKKASFGCVHIVYICYINKNNSKAKPGL